MKVSELVSNLVPYVPGKPIEETRREFKIDRVVKLASNENPLGPSPKAVAAVEKQLGELHRYPDPSCFELKIAMAQFLHQPPERLAFGNGSDEIIDLLIKIYCATGRHVLMYENSFAAYKIAAHAGSVLVDEVPLKGDFALEPQSLLKSYCPDQHALVFLVNPNNPTGRYLSERDLTSILDGVSPTETLVVVDEAYLEFVEAQDYPKTLPLLDRYPHLVILRTMSKAYGLAGLRVGTMIAQPAIVDLIHRVRKPFNVNWLGQVGARAALDDQEHVRKTVELTLRERRGVQKQLTAMGLHVTPSEGNFLMFNTPYDSQLVFQNLLKRGIILRPLRNYGLMTQLRMSIGTEEENTLALSALTEVLQDLRAQQGGRNV